MSAQKLFLISLRLLEKDSGVPEWVISTMKQARSDNQKLINLSVEGKEVSASYLDFLREQIDLKPRGVEWAGRLKQRLNKLAPFEGEKLVFISLYKGRSDFSAYIDIKKEKIVYCELIE